ncbi:chitin synthase-domain-containing protein [Mycotypha africana]|uniref:chitin synthase-domain-containing protein n=1 Tax=Mycotypha africana TaxID=64632 RepID=UPI0023010B45|nr:chitin synthase-domain-containing protein [Mycotypha africana]KAI8982417.1 chitin synthase-domain-containing protein [Mycotypha africana]
MRPVPPQHHQQQRMQSFYANRPSPPPSQHQSYASSPRPQHQNHHQYQQMHNNNKSRTSINPSPHQQQQQRMYSSARQPTQRMPAGGMRPHPSQHHPGQGAPYPPMVPGSNNQSAMSGPYQRVSMNRSRSLSRPERQRPRAGMIRSPSQQQRLQQQARYYGQPQPQYQSLLNSTQHQPSMHQRPVPPNNSHPNPNHNGRFLNPMSNRLQQQLQQQKYQQQQLLQQQQQQQQQQQEALLNQSLNTNNKKLQKSPPDEPEEKIKVLTSWWAWIAYLATCCIPNWFLRICLKKRNAMVQQAWREKLTLCYIIFLLCAALAFVTYGLNRTLCPTPGGNSPFSRVVNGQRIPVYYSSVRVFGQIYPMDVMKSFFASHGLNLTNDYENTDISGIFNGDVHNDCARYPIPNHECALVNPYGGGLAAPDNSCLSFAELKRFYKSNTILGFDWQDLDSKLMYGRGLVLVGDSVLNVTDYLINNQSYYGQDVDRTIRTNLAKDVSYALLYTSNGKNARKCLAARYRVGIMETETGGCIADSIIMTLMLVVIIVMIVIRYAMALLFQWFISSRLIKPGGRSNWLAWRSIKGGNDDPANHIPGPYNHYAGMQQQQGSSTSLNSTSFTGSTSRSTPNINNNSSIMGLNNSGARSDIVTTELYTVMLVTCYSEGEEGLRITMDSLAETTYSKKHKIFFVIADGMITGAGETKSTPDIVISMMDLDPTMTDPKPASYLAIADGEKQLNMAKVYAGHYKGVPCITIVKSGTEEEANGSKAGNRGKRDSQLILMSFFQRVLFNDRLSELDYEMFWKMTWLMKGVTPDKFELVLMVDADTKVLPDALTYMVAAMANDITIMGLCGETRIANKRASWVTAIQVFEYYISHHYAKAFESLFGIVTCLPGCFSMYRIKSPKNGAWVPILANPDIILEYNQNIVTTLHEKNLLLLGEDRFLSTLMLRTFPRRQMMFVPQARCKTVVPDQFKVLLSQRRRWINSTVHNLMELVLVSDLCGIACLSMQFSVFVDLIGTLVLPAAIVMTIYLIVDTAISTNPQWQSLALLIAILGLPAVLIAITTLKFIYILWMFVYICALPIWNFILPLYSFWHFDDFSWGATRVVAGEKKDKGHGDAEGKFDPSRLLMKKWEDWEQERTGQRFHQHKKASPLKTPYDSMTNLLTPSPTTNTTASTLTPTTTNTGTLGGGVYHEHGSGIPMSQTVSVATPTPQAPASFGNIFNDRKMYGSSPVPTLTSLPNQQQ